MRFNLTPGPFRPSAWEGAPQCDYPGVPHNVSVSRRLSPLPRGKGPGVRFFSLSYISPLYAPPSIWVLVPVSHWARAEAR